MWGYRLVRVSKTSHLDENHSKKHVPPTPFEKDIFTSRKHSMDYFTMDGVILRTGYKNKLDWYLLPIREILDNDADFLWKYYKDADKASISVNVTMDDELFRLTIRNSNHKNIPVFSDLGPIFDYDMRYGSKQDVHIISRGMLGDAMKQILSLGYVLLHTSDDGTAFTDKQWEYPLIIRHNKKEWKSIDSVHVRLNDGAVPTLLLLPSPVEGDDPFQLYTVMVFACVNVILELHDKIGLRVGPLELGSRGEWVAYDPVANSFCKSTGQVTYDGIGKVNASPPRHIGEFEFHDPRALVDYLAMPKRIQNIEGMLEKFLSRESGKV
jgi:hypothetical protein